MEFRLLRRRRLVRCFNCANRMIGGIGESKHVDVNFRCGLERIALRTPWISSYPFTKHYFMKIGINSVLFGGYDMTAKPIKKIDEGTGGLEISGADAKAIIADKRSILKKRAKEFAELMSPHATKKMITDVAGAASESFAGSTGDTRQDIVNGILNIIDDMDLSCGCCITCH